MANETWDSICLWLRRASALSRFWRPRPVAGCERVAEHVVLSGEEPELPVVVLAPGGTFVLSPAFSAAGHRFLPHDAQGPVEGQVSCVHTPDVTASSAL